MIKKITVKNFKIHKLTEIHFSEQLSILTGENNSGKTSLLEAVMIFWECYKVTLRKIQRPTNSHVKSGKLKVGQFDFSGIFIPYFLSVRSENYFELFYQGAESFNLSAEFEIQGSRFTLGFEVSQGRNQTAYNVIPTVDISDLEVFNQFDPDALFEVFNSSPVASVMRNEPYLHPKMLEKMLAEGAQASTIRNRLLHISQQHKLTDLQGQLQYVMNFDYFELKVRFDPNQDLYVTVEFRTDKKMDFQDIAMLGSGTLQMLEVMVSLNLASKSLMRVVVLDEPDSYLHRRLQTNLIKKLREISMNGVQIICTTHNEQVIASARLSEVFHLGNPRQAQVIKSLSADLPNGRHHGALAPKSKMALYDSLGVSASAMNILEAIEADQVVLVEGRGDALYIDALQAKRQALFPTQGPRRVAFWSINGVSDLANKLHYWKDILSGLKNSKTIWDKSILVLDADYLSLKEVAILQNGLKKKLEIDAFFWKSYTIESLFLTDLTAFKKSAANWLGLDFSTVEVACSSWADKISVESKKVAIAAQRQNRSLEYERLGIGELSDLAGGNCYADYLAELNGLDNSAFLANKDDFFELIDKLINASQDEMLAALSDEAKLLAFIESLDASAWQTDWTEVLKRIYG
ncbi:MAG: AAA family ATPase [Gallionellaceae bacterium]